MPPTFLFIPQVAPAELEAVLLSHPSVSDAGVVGLQDPVGGEVPLAWVVKQQGVHVTDTALHEFVNSTCLHKGCMIVH